MNKVLNLWFQPLVKTRCLCGRKHVQVFGWGNYVAANWHTVLHFCSECFHKMVIQNSWIVSMRNQGYTFKACARRGYSLADWIKVS
jgi:transposase